MPHELLPPPDVRRRVYELWDELADFQAADTDNALLHLLREVSRLITAQNAYWVGAVRILDDDTDPMQGWRPRIVRHLHPSTADDAFGQKAIKDLGEGTMLDESTLAHARQAGTFRAPLIRELVSPAWFESPFYKWGYEARGIVDALFVVFPLNGGAEAYYGFQRKHPWTPFAESDRVSAAYAIRGLKWLHRQLMLGHGLLAARSPLRPAERRVLRLLLTDVTEKELARRLGLTQATVHQYATDIYRKYDVSGRAGLMALWLGHAASARLGRKQDNGSA